VSRNYGWAAAEMLGVNWVASAFNEYGRNGNFTQVSPRSWWRNLGDGFAYDDNDFRTNQFIHSYNGNVYFNSARANGLNFWTSAAFATFGAFMWEFAGETHPMSYNDMIATSVGGFTMGEMTYRLSSEILNNKATGGTRFFKEFSSFVVDPVRGSTASSRAAARLRTRTPRTPWIGARPTAAPCSPSVCGPSDRRPSEPTPRPTPTSSSIMPTAAHGTTSAASRSTTWK
jgi:hypothetical protein